MHKLPLLPYAYDALEPVISRETLEYHHDKHHRACVQKVNELRLAPARGAKPTGALATAIDENFDSFTEFKQQFTIAGETLFGSGWTWLAATPDGSLQIVTTQDAGCPLNPGLRPLLTCDVWEHAYYIDYRNRRPDSLKGFCKIVNWDFVSAEFLAEFADC